MKKYRIEKFDEEKIYTPNLDLTFKNPKDNVNHFTNHNEWHENVIAIFYIQNQFIIYTHKGFSPTEIRKAKDINLNNVF